MSSNGNRSWADARMFLTARGYPEVDGDGPEVHPTIMYDFIGRSNRALWCSQKPQRIRTQPNHFNEPFKSDTA